MPRLAFWGARRAVPATTGTETGSGRTRTPRLLGQSLCCEPPEHEQLHVRTASRSQYPSALLPETPHSARRCSFRRLGRANAAWAIGKEPREQRRRPAHCAPEPQRGGLAARRTPLHTRSHLAPSKIGRARSPLPIPSAAKFHPRAGTARGAASRAHTPAPHQTPKRGKSPPQTPNSLQRPERRQKQR